MKKIISMCVALSLALSVWGCGVTPPIKEEPPIVPPVEEVVDYKTYGSYWMGQHDYKTMPVAAYNSCPPQLSDFTYNYLTSENTFKDYAKAGVNTMMGLYEYAGQYTDQVLQALDWCQDNKLSYLIAYSGAGNVNNVSGPNSVLSRIKYHDAFGGIMLADEPGYVQFDNNKTARGIFEKVMPEDVTKKLYHVNLFPTYASEKQLYFRNVTSDQVLPEGGYSYAQYLDDYVKTYDPQVLSYDYYPIRGGFPDLSAGYFDNMSIIKAKAQSVNIPFWVFLQTCSYYDGQRIPNQDEIKWLVNTSLSYGAKGIQYFTGVVPTNSEGGEVFKGAMFDRDGNKTPMYDYVKNANTQIMAVDEVLMRCKSQGVIFEGIMPWSYSEEKCLDIPANGVITSYKELTKVDANHALVGCFDFKGSSAYYVTNNAISSDPHTAIGAQDDITLNFSKNVKGYKIVDGKKEAFSGNKITITLTAGNGALIVLE